MLLRSLGLIIERPIDGLVTMGALLLALVVAITFHEFCHALSAKQLGDLTAARQGRLSLNPLAHLDPLGSMMILLAGFGWGKPVPVNAYNLRPQLGALRGMSVVAAAGPISNVLMAVLASLPIRLGLVDLSVVGFIAFDSRTGDPIAYFLQAIIILNLALASFNLLPIAPLDGFKVVLGLLPSRAAAQFSRLEPIGPIILLGLILLDYALPGPGILSAVIEPVFEGLARLVLAGHI